MSPSCLPWLLLLQVLLLHSTEIAAEVPAIIIFGDSTVDAGNNNFIPTIARSNFEPYGRDFNGGQPTGRFCNGRLATDFISQAFGLPSAVPAYLDPQYGIKDFATGVCFASAGSGYDNATSDVFSVIPLWRELEYFKEYQEKLKAYQGEAKARETLSEAVYVISLGTNDFLENYYTVPGGRRSQYNVEQYQDFLIGIAEDFIRDLHRLGARKIDLTGLPPMGCLPLERVANPTSRDACNEIYNKVASNFNSKLQRSINKLNRELPGIAIVYGDIYYVLLGVIKKPLTFGFEDAVSGCCATGMFEMGYTCNRRSLFTCQDANKYVFWDAFHPTERMNLVIAAQLMKTTLGIFK
ncbi:LOW QUALITY PROTEIN: GDSL esterase/lipase At2g04570-like [Phoenix dactylifera]|uniref:LOW QUALITY PROTEIN: GDSL esterase/lipase At2g04570-like n=1 Tax=Phoenix dactylifera TaxID=42345 RepID=A0A8B7CHT3_PHODC|nr:LOW QUALITY PROTEIN: GDSL esterase/lipase At2g04570-like [Phoenix dactylifera]